MLKHAHKTVRRGVERSSDVIWLPDDRMQKTGNPSRWWYIAEILQVQRDSYKSAQKLDVSNNPHSTSSIISLLRFIVQMKTKP